MLSWKARFWSKRAGLCASNRSKRAGPRASKTTPWLVLVSLFCACEWTPKAGPVKPERLARGEFLVRGMLDHAGSRFAWVTRRDEDGVHHLIFDLQSRSSCELPEETFPLVYPLKPPAQTKDVVFLWPLLKRSLDLEDSVVFVDERCEEKEFSSTAGAELNAFALNDDRGSALLVSNGKGRLSFVDPWREEENLIATGVGPFQQLYTSAGEAKTGPQALWMIEKGQLRLRNLDGTLRVTLGADVTAFTQGVFSQLRISFVAGGNLYEAVAPKFQPVLLARDACSPAYRGTQLDFKSPCADQQLMRIDLTTGTTEEFEPGVFEQWEVRGVSFERQRQKEDEVELYVTPPEGERTLVTPYLPNPQLIDSKTMAGRTADGRFGVWNLDAGFRELLRGVPERGITGFVDSRTSALLWIIHHDVKDEIGTLSLLEQSQLRFTELAGGVPVSKYTVSALQQVPEPILVALRDAEPFAFDEKGVPTRFRGTLEVSLVSGALPSEIDADASSYTLVYDVEAGGLLYAIDSGDSQGLWFAGL